MPDQQTEESTAPTGPLQSQDRQGQPSTERARAIARVVAQIVRAAPRAIKTLRRNLDCGRPSEEIKAAAALLAHVGSGLTLVEQLFRVEDMGNKIEALTKLILANQQSATAAKS